MTRLLIILLILVVFLVNPPPLYAKGYQVKITGTGFEPVEISISQGDSIEFINLDTKDHWPASDPHPIHNFYQGFDPKQPIKPNKSWIFVFKNSGGVGYHDHLSPHLKGEIKVLGDAKQTEPEPNWLNKQFNNLPSFLDRIKNFFSNLRPAKKTAILGISEFRSLETNDQQIKLQDIANKEGVQKAWEFFKDAYKNDAGFAGNIHDLAHLLGGLIFQKEGFRGLSTCTTDFAFGCYHGFFDLAFRNDLNNLPEAENSCLKVGAAGSGPNSSCIHGIGHGVASFFKVSDLDDALKACDKLVKSPPMYCYDGVFMEFARNASISFYRSDDPLYPCNSLDPKYYSTCGRNIPALLMQRFNFQYEQVVPICLSAQPEEIRSACIDSLGFAAASRSQGQAESIFTDCSLLGHELFIAKCAQAGAGELIFQNSPNWQNQAFSVCAKLPDYFQVECTGYLNNLVREYHRG